LLQRGNGDVFEMSYDCVVFPFPQESLMVNVEMIEQIPSSPEYTAYGSSKASNQGVTPVTPMDLQRYENLTVRGLYPSGKAGNRNVSERRGNAPTQKSGDSDDACRGVAARKPGCRHASRGHDQVTVAALPMGHPSRAIGPGLRARWAWGRAGPARDVTTGPMP
jgi:hypothetical protein